jgi:hypothetical protein
MSVGSAIEERTRAVTAAHALLAEENAASEFTIDELAARVGVARAQVHYGRCWHGQRRVIRRIKACAAFDPSSSARCARESWSGAWACAASPNAWRAAVRSACRWRRRPQVLAPATSFKLFDSLSRSPT